MRFKIQTTQLLRFLVPICYRWRSSMRTKILLSPRNMDQETLHFIWPVDMDTLWVWEKLYRDTPYKLCLNFLRRPEKGKRKNRRPKLQSLSDTQFRKTAHVCVRRVALFRLDFLKVVRLVFWSGVVGPAFARSRSALVRSRFALTVALRVQKLDLWASLFFGVSFIWRVGFLYIIFCWSSLVSFLGIYFAILYRNAFKLNAFNWVKG